MNLGFQCEDAWIMGENHVWDEQLEFWPTPQWLQCAQALSGAEIGRLTLWALEPAHP